jgi:parallel beta helix pectate lyase-like protein
LTRLFAGTALVWLLAPSARAGLCPPLPAPPGNVVDVTPAQAGQLAGIVGSAGSGDTIRLADGTYLLNGGLLHFSTPGVTLRSASGNRDAVVLDNDYQGGDLILIRASNVTIADLTVRRAWYHPIHVTPASSHVTGTLIHNVRVVDPGEQAIKINADGTQTLFVDDGVIRCSRIELTDAGRPQIRNNCYTGGVDAHRARGWRIRDNVIEGFWCPSGLSEHGIHLWTGSRDTVVERNQIRNCARGIGLGLGSATPGRTYLDNPCGGAANIGHYDGVVRNNFVFANDDRLFDQGAGGFDLGIGLEQACGARVLHNTVVSTRPPFSSIEGRFANTVATMTNNLMSHNLRPRDGASLTLAGNLQNAPPALFVDAVLAGDLHLVDGAAAAIDQGAFVPAGQADEDIDGDRREPSRDIGADERSDLIFADGFEAN